MALTKATTTTITRKTSEMSRENISPTSEIRTAAMEIIRWEKESKKRE